MFKSISWIDLKLGVRMLVKYPWLTAVGGLGMAVAVAIGASFFGIIYSMMDSTLPLDDGHRIVSIQNWDNAVEDRPDRRILHDFHLWRQELDSIVDVGAFRNVSRNVVAPYGEPEPINIAEMSAAGFRVARVRPLLGRFLLDSDEQPNAPPVAVIGHEVWRDRFGSDPAIIGRTAQVGAGAYKIVGVMPEGFEFPLRNKIWLPLRFDPADYEPRKGPILYAFGRLAPGVSLQDAQHELDTIGKQAAAASPATHAQLEPRVLPYTYPFFDIDDMATMWAYHVLQMAITLLLVLVCANVATLVYARTATRRGEIAVRTALGASRWRIISQLFAEALVLAAVASVAGITIAKWALRQVHIFLEETMHGLPFWMNIDVSIGVMLYVVGVTFLGAMIVGALPALKATSRRLHPQLRELGGGSGMHLGKIWTALIVAQVAFAVAILPATTNYALEFGRTGIAGPGFPAGEYLTALLSMEQQIPPVRDADSYYRERNALFNTRQATLLEQLRGEPMVRAASFAMSNPGEEPTAMLQIEGLPTPTEEVDYSLGAGTRHGYVVRPNRVDLDFFSAFEIPLRSGRLFNASDRDAEDRAVIVNDDFVRMHLGDRPAVGRKLRYVGRGGDTDSVNIPLGRWFTIVGVVADFPPNDITPRGASPRIYHPPLAASTYHTLFLRTRGNSTPSAFAPRLRQIATTLDPTLQVRSADSLDEVVRMEQRMMRLGAIALIALTGSVLLLSAAGIYSLMSLTVNQRRREIGVRAALGADSRRILAGVFKRAVRQLMIGVVVGVAASLVLDRLMWGEILRGQGAVLLPAVATLMVVVGLLAAMGPARRGMRIQPTEALREI